MRSTMPKLTQKEIEMLNDVSIHIDHSLKEVWAQVKMQGCAFMVDLRQLAGRGYPAFQGLGLSVAEIEAVPYSKMLDGLIELTSESGLFHVTESMRYSIKFKLFHG